MATETALVLDAEAAGRTSAEPVHFGGFPGVWAPDRPIAVWELGFASEEEALARAAELELPLREVRVDVGSAPMPARPNHELNDDQQQVLDRELATPEAPTIRTHADADAAAEAAGVSFPDDAKTVAQKVAFLEAQAADPAGGDGPTSTGAPAPAGGEG